MHFEGRAVATLRPGCPPYTFGRGRDRSLRFDVGPDGHCHVSREAGSIRWADGVWLVCNDSKSRPFDVVVDGVPNPVHPRTSPAARSMWAVGPRPTKIQVAAGPRLYLLLLVPIDPPSRPPPPPASGGDPELPDTPPLNGPTDHERLFLAARFLSLPEPGEALESNIEAAEYARAALPPEKAQKVTEPAVANVVHRWKKELERRGVQGLADASTIGRQLLAWGDIQQEDRRLLRPWRPPPTPPGLPTR